MKTYTANENCFLIDGEVYLINKISLVNLKNNCSRNPVLRTLTIGEVTSLYIWFGNVAFIVTHSTKTLDGVKLLPRDKFVKPKDVEKLAGEFAEKSDWIPWSQEGLAFECFKAGHNANPNEFTIDHLKTAWAYGVEASGTFQDLLKIIIPLSLPERIEINEQGEIVNVIW